MSQDENFPIPDAAVIEKAASAEAEETELGYRADFVELPPNLAGNTKLVEHFHRVAYAHYQRQQAQPQRKELTDNMRSNDAMYRVGLRRDRTVQGSAQQQDTLSNVASIAFYRSIKVITATQTAALLPSEGLAAKYEPSANSEDYGDEEGRRIADGRNALLRYTWEEDKWDTSLRRSLLYNNKYSQELIAEEWARLTETKVCRVPGYYTKAGEPVEVKPGETPEGEMFSHDGKPLSQMFDEAGQPQSTVFVEKTLVTKDCPTLYRHDLKDVSLDWTIDDIQQQSCVVLRSQKTLAEVIALQWDNEFLNLGKMSDAQQFTGEDKNAQTTEPLKDRQDNKGQDHESEKNGLLDVYRVWLRAPIDSDFKRGKTEKTRGKWDPDGAMPVWHEAYFVGPFGQLATDDKDKPQGCVCICLRKNPYHHGKLPYNLLHTHEDDTGAVRMGYGTLAACLYEEETATINEHFDNKTLRTYSPWVAEKGNVLSRDLKFKHGNQVIFVKPGTGQTALTKLDVPDTTGTTLATLEWIDGQFNKVLFTDKPISGEYAGARTTGTEFQGVRDQAMLPVIEDLRFVAGQLYPWLLETTAALWEQFGDPAKKLKIQNGVISPTQLYGDYKVKIVSIDAFIADLTLRQMLISMVQSGAIDKAAPFMGQEGGLEFWRDFFKVMKTPGFYKYFPKNVNLEAVNQAWSDVTHLLADPEGAMQEGLPQEGEKHEIHIRILQTYLDRYLTVTPKDEQNPAIVRAFQTYILLHEQMQEAEGQQMSAQAPAAPAPGAPPTPEMPMGPPPALPMGAGA